VEESIINGEGKLAGIYRTVEDALNKLEPSRGRSIALTKLEESWLFAAKEQQRT
jgi:hypothetical protein